jgi:hypothetical protein
LIGQVKRMLRKVTENEWAKLLFVAIIFSYSFWV